MKLIYRLGQKKKETSFDNDDLSFVKQDNQEQHIIKVIAKKDIVLLNAIIEEPYEFKDGDQAFLNGYSAWTATKTVDNKYKEMNIYKKFTKLLYKFIPADTYGDYFFHKYKRNCIHGYEKNYCLGDFGFFSKWECENDHPYASDSCGFKCLTTKEQIEETMMKDISDPSICGAKEPKIAALLWVLHNGQADEKNEIKIQADKNEKKTSFGIKKIWRSIMEMF